MWLWSLFGSGTLEPARYSRLLRLRMTRLQLGSTFNRRWPLASRTIRRVADTLSRMLQGALGAFTTKLYFFRMAWSLSPIADESAACEKELLLELYRENKHVTPTTLVENLGHLRLDRKGVRWHLSKLRREKDWTITNNQGHWGLTTSGKQHVEKLLEEINASNWDEVQNSEAA